MSWAEGENAVSPNKVGLPCAALIPPEPIDWVWPGWLAAGKFHLLAGASGAGKTAMAVSVAASAANSSISGSGK